MKQECFTYTIKIKSDNFKEFIESVQITLEKYKILTVLKDDFWKEMWMKRYRDWPTRDIENLKTAIAKLQAKIDKEQL